MYRKFNYFFFRAEKLNTYRVETNTKSYHIKYLKFKRGDGGLLIAYMPHSHIPKDDGEFSKIKMFNLKS